MHSTALVFISVVLSLLVSISSLYYSCLPHVITPFYSPLLRQWMLFLLLLRLRCLSFHLFCFIFLTCTIFCSEPQSPGSFHWSTSRYFVSLVGRSTCARLLTDIFCVFAWINNNSNNYNYYYYYYSIWMSLVTGLFCLVILLNQQWSPPLRLQVSHCSNFRIMCDVPNIAYYYYYYYYLLQLGCHPVAVVILHVYKIWNWSLIDLNREGYMRSM